VACGPSRPASATTGTGCPSWCSCRSIRLLSHIPDEELDRLARWGFRGLWLIGVWERSTASRKIKQWTGNPEAEASAYSLYDYTIATDLGGEEAWRDLRDRAWARGIRLASDMVPNHMGIDSRWVIEHPDWFIQLREPPYPWYTFGGGDLSEDQRVGVFLEDGYWERRDAAVVFKRLDRHTGDARYIYHGNDGTSMPWNDTAQLNYLLPEVREAVIQTILHVARLFPIIRFDAAMTLAKKHYQRLWFPVPGNAGAVPSRAEHSLSPADFQAAFPEEFWRQVVDRIAAEAPDTLLLAEAFWLMEGYFVRTLGMHRVYNSAFMNMLKMEENAKYRQTVKNVLEFSPEVLKRFVNFMNNPDERTAIDQFGKGDKYIGVALLMVTMPGLPMFGHGQVEGLTEKYGMEYRRAYWDEQVDEDTVRRHESEIFPLMRRRRLFSGAENFAFYDFVTPEGHVDENVFAYSNRADSERALILYNNAYQTTRGRIHTSTAINAGRGDETFLVRRTLVEALGLDTAADCLYAFREARSGLRFLRRGRELAEQGLYAELLGYAYNAFLDFEELRDKDGSWHRLADRLGGRGVFDLHLAHRELELEPILDPFRALLALDTGAADSRPDLAKGLAAWLRAAARRLDHQEVTGANVAAAITELDDILQEPAASPGPESSAAVDFLGRRDPGWPRLALAWTALQALGRLASPSTRSEPTTAAMRASAMKRAHQLAGDWLLLKAAEDTWRERSGDGRSAHWDAQLLDILLACANPLVELTGGLVEGSLDRAFADERIANFLQIHEHAGERWLHKEQLERLLGAWARAAGTTAAATVAAQVAAAAEAAGYRLQETLSRLASTSPPGKPSGSS
jgi:glycosidase